MKQGCSHWLPVSPSWDFGCIGCRVGIGGEGLSLDLPVLEPGNLVVGKGSQRGERTVWGGLVPEGLALLLDVHGEQGFSVDGGRAKSTMGALGAWSGRGPSGLSGVGIQERPVAGPVDHDEGGEGVRWNLGGFARCFRGRRFCTGKGRRL